MPPKAKRSAPPPRFLFVNEDAKSVTRVVKDPELDREKQSHVQRHNFAKRKQLLNEEQGQPSRAGRGNTELVKQKDTASIAAQQITDWGFNNDTFVYPESPFRNPEAFQSSPETALQKVSLDAGYSYEPTDYLQPSVARFPLQRHPLQTRTVHPLFSGSMQILQKWAPPLMEHFNTVILPEKFFADSRVQSLNGIRHAASIHEQSAKALTQPVHLYAFLASAAIRMLNREGKLLLPDVKEEDYHRVPLYFKGKAMEALRKALVAGVTHDLVHDVHHLISVAYFSHCYDAAMPHLEAMQAMIEQLGGIRTFDDYFEETNILLDWSAALRTVSAPRLPFDWDPGYGPPAIADRMQLLGSSYDDLGLRMRSKIAAGQIGSELACSFEDMILLTKFHRWAKDQPYQPEHFRYIVLRHVAIGCRLLFMGPRSGNGGREEAFRIAMIFWTALTRSPASGKRCASVGVARLRAALEFSGADGWGDHDDMLLWTTVVGGLTARQQDDIDWFARLAAKTAKRVDQEVFSDFGEMENLLTGFLYEPSMQLEPLLDLRTKMRRATSPRNSS